MSPREQAIYLDGALLILESALDGAMRRGKLTPYDVKQMLDRVGGKIAEWRLDPDGVLLREWIEVQSALLHPYGLVLEPRDDRERRPIPVSLSEPSAEPDDGLPPFDVAMQVTEFNARVLTLFVRQSGRSREERLQLLARAIEVIELESAEEAEPGNSADSEDQAED